MAKVEPDSPGVDDPGQGRRLALDVGTVRIGVAVSNREATLATPVETVRRETGFKTAIRAILTASWSSLIPMMQLKLSLACHGTCREMAPKA